MVFDPALPARGVRPAPRSCLSQSAKQGVMAEALEIRLRRAPCPERRGDRGGPDRKTHHLQDPVRRSSPGQRAVAGTLYGCPARRRAALSRRGDPGPAPRPAVTIIRSSCPPASSATRATSARTSSLLVGGTRKSSDHLAAVGDRAGQVAHGTRPGRGSAAAGQGQRRPDSPARQPGLSGQPGWSAAPAPASDTIPSPHQQ